MRINNMIAVSTSGFSSTAIKLAKSKGIETRILQEFDPQEVIDWVGKKSMGLIESIFEIKGIDIFLKQSNQLKEVSQQELSKSNFRSTAEGKVLIREKQGDKISIADIVRIYNEDNDQILFKDIKENEPPIEKLVKFFPKDSNSNLLISTKIGLAEIDYLLVLVSFRKIKTYLSLTKIKKYLDEKGILAERLEYDCTQYDGKQLTFIIQRDKKVGKIEIFFHTEP